MRKLTLAAIVLVGCTAVACAPATRFEWGNYETTLYAYAKHPEARDAYRNALVAAIAKGQASNRVAPGLYAELGYLRLEDGDRDEAIRCFEQEMLLFPESAQFMSGVIARVKTGASSASVNSMREGVEA
jgi:hypothetical protein